MVEKSVSEAILGTMRYGHWGGFKILSLTLGMASVFASVYFLSKMFFESQFMIELIWNVNTFRGMFAHLPDHFPTETILGAYALELKDYYAHLPRSVSQNSSYYAVLIASSCALSLVVAFLRRFASKGHELEAVGNWIHYGVIVAVGLWARFFLAYHTTGNQDIAMTYVNMEILAAGKNLYAVSDNFNYSPVWLWMLQFLGGLSRLVPHLPFMFVLRAFVSLADLVTLILVIRTASLIKFPPQKAAALFFLNPISIIISGYHGQIEGLTVLCLMAGLYVILRSGPQALHAAWLCITIGIAIKHVIINQVLVVLRYLGCSRRRAMLYFTMTLVIFLGLFIPYWQGGSDRIIANVFHYRGVARPYGFGLFHLYPKVLALYQYVFMGLFLVWPLLYRTPNVLRASLIAVLLFLVFTPGISAQQFVLPVALGALSASHGFYLFSAFATLFLCGDIDELKIQTLEFFSWNLVWIAAVVWFVLEVFGSRHYNLGRGKS